MKNDEQRGDVIVAKKLAGLKAGDLKKSIAAGRDWLRQAADDAGVVAVLTWASSGIVASPTIGASASPGS